MKKVEVTFAVSARGVFAPRVAVPPDSPKNLFGKIRKAATSLAEKAEKALRIDEAKTLVLEVHVSVPENGQAVFSPPGSPYGVEIHSSEMFPEPSSTPSGLIGIFKPCLFMLPPNSDCRVRLRIRTSRKTKGNDVEPLVQTEFSMATLLKQLETTPCVALCTEVQVIALPPVPERNRRLSMLPASPAADVDLLSDPVSMQSAHDMKEALETSTVALNRALLGGHQGKLNPMQMSYCITQSWSLDPTLPPEVSRFRDTLIEPDIVKSIPLSLLVPTAKGLLNAAQAMRRVYHLERLRRRQFNSAAEAKANGYKELRVAVENGVGLANATVLQGMKNMDQNDNAQAFPLGDLLQTWEYGASKPEALAAEKGAQGSRICQGLEAPPAQIPAIVVQQEAQSFTADASASIRALSSRLVVRERPLATGLEEADGEIERSKTTAASRKIYSFVTMEVRCLPNDDGSGRREPWEGFFGQTDSVVAGSNPVYSRAGARTPRQAASKVLSDGTTISTYLPASAAEDPLVVLVFRVWQMLDNRSSTLIGEAAAALSAFVQQPGPKGTPRVHALRLSRGDAPNSNGSIHVKVGFDTPRHDQSSGVGVVPRESGVMISQADVTLASMLQGLTEEKEDSDEEEAQMEPEPVETSQPQLGELQLRDFLPPELAEFAERVRDETARDLEEWIGDVESWEKERIEGSSMEGKFGWLCVCGFSPMPSLDSVVMEPPPPSVEEDNLGRDGLVPRLNSSFRPANPSKSEKVPDDGLLLDTDSSSPRRSVVGLNAVKSASSVDPISDVMRNLAVRLTPLHSIRDTALLYYQLYSLVETMVKKETIRLEQEELFRSSKLKMDKSLQAAPMNLHIHIAELFVPPSTAGITEAVLDHGVDYVTCGAATAHAFGFKPGGLLKNVSMLEELEKKIMDVYNTLSLYNWEPRYQEQGTLFEPVFEKLCELYAYASEFESLRTLTAVRRMCTLSQALCTCVATFVSRLYLMLYEEFRPPPAFSSAIEEDKTSALEKIAPIWANAGFFIYWEGLLSSAGKEKGMIEDVVATLEVIHSFWRVRLHLASQPAKSDDVRAQCRIRPAECRLDIYIPRIFAQKFEGNEAAILLTHDIKLRPVLLTQGIDIRQTMANLNLNLGMMVLNKAGTPTERASSQPSNSTAARLQQAANVNLNPMFRGGAEFQKNVNEYGVSFFESYLSQILRHRVEGDEAPAAAAVAALSAAVQEQDVTAKNTAVLINAEIASDELGGGRVTFCKSGKDRTAMAITLEQTRRIYGGASPDGRPSDAEDSERMRLTNVLRLGTRLQVAQKNIGYSKYSFNMLQRRFLPKAYQAPPETIQDYMTSALNADS